MSHFHKAYLFHVCTIRINSEKKKKNSFDTPQILQSVSVNNSILFSIDIFEVK